ncbi:phage holin family protein [Candidatus Gracilibacteria bacterium]|nr:phage holin family protein [Candidatus Gracilibacteria bacterium]
MKTLISILLNALILYIMAFLLGENSAKGLEAGIVVTGGIKTYILGGIILGVMNVTLRPIIKIVSFPLVFIFFGLVAFFINGITLKAFNTIMQILVIPGVTYQINGWVNFLIAVAIFTILNMVYSFLSPK